MVMYCPRTTWQFAIQDFIFVMHTFIACKIGYEIVWSPPMTNGLQPFSISFPVCSLISFTAIFKSNELINMSPTSATTNESYGDAPMQRKTQSQLKGIFPQKNISNCLIETKEIYT